MSDLTTLLKKTTLDSHEEILKAANTALKKSKTDPTAHHAKVIALLKLDRYDDAVAAFDTAGEAVKKEGRLEYAYALYKAGQLEKAEEIAQAGEVEGRGMKHVLAQTTYRLEKFGRAGGLYAELADGSRSAAGEGNDLRINSAAVDAQLEWQGSGHLVTKKSPAREDLEAFESAYNVACGAIARGEFGKGEVLLRRARDLCMASEELSEEEKRAEMVPIIAQMLYVLVRLGRLEAAKGLAEELDVETVPDEATRWVAKVNRIVADGHAEGGNAFLTHRLFSLGPKLEGSERPFGYQTAILKQDGVITDLLACKYAGVIRRTSAELEASEEPSTASAYATISVLNAAAHAKGQTNKAGLKAVLPLLLQRPTDVGLLLTVVQLYLLTNNRGSAILLLESFFDRLEHSETKGHADIRYAPGLIGVLVSLYTKEGRKTRIKTELAKAASYWRTKRKSDKTSPLPAPLLRAAGTALLESGETEDAKSAGDIFKDLHDIDPDDRASTAGLIASYAISDPSAVPAAALEKLTPASRLISDIDAAALEDAGIARPTTTSSAAPAASKKRAAPSAAVGGAEKKSRISKTRMPKEFVDGKEMDKERWLPLRDRSYWKPKGKKGKARQAGLTQGGAEDEKVASKGTVGTVATAGSGGVGKNKKKKGKGGKK